MKFASAMRNAQSPSSSDFFEMLIFLKFRLGVLNNLLLQIYIYIYIYIYTYIFIIIYLKSVTVY